MDPKNEPNFDIKMLHSQFEKRYAPLGVNSQTDLNIRSFLSQYPSQSWSIDSIRVFFTKDIFTQLESLLSELQSNEQDPITPPKQKQDKIHKTIIFLVSGKRCSGKDTIASCLRDSLKSSDYDCIISHFADEFKRMFCEYAHLDFEKMMADRDYKEAHRLPMTEYYHKISKQNVSFAGNLANRINALVAKGFDKKTFFVIPDLRAKNEVNCFRKLRSSCPGVVNVLVRVNISDAARSQRGWTKSTIDNDTTETDLDEWDDWDYCFENSRPGTEWMQKFVSQQLEPLLKAML